MITRTLLAAAASLALAALPLSPPAHAAPAAVPSTLAASTLPASTTPAPAPLLDRLPRIVYVAHRGGSLEVPENSISGLLTAYRQGAAQMLDVDTRMLRDGTLVAMHDKTLNRTTDTVGPVRDLDREQWNQVRVRPAVTLHGTWKPERPPTVAEVLDRFGGRIPLTLEAKDPAMLPRLAREIHRRGLTRSVFVNTHSPEVARRIHRQGLLTQLWRSAKDMRTDDPAQWRGFVDLLDVDHRARAWDLYRAAYSGIPRVWAHTVNTPADRDRALRLGCNGIITDAPALLARTRAR